MMPYTASYNELWNKIKGWAQQDIDEYYELLTKHFIPLNPKAVVELGTASGGAFWGFCEASSDDTVLISIDQSHGGIADKIKSRSKKGIIISGDTHDKSVRDKVSRIIKEIDFLFIDADHSYESVKADYELWSPLVRNGGIIAIHDVTCGSCPGVMKLWGELKKIYKESYEIDYTTEKEEHHGYGIGVLVKNV